MALPQLSAEERAANLAKAAKVRQERAILKAKLKSGELMPASVLADTDNPVVARMKVVSLVESLPGYGKAKAAKLLEELEISESRRIQGLGSRQRENLIKALS